jgi:hypothetical protein
MALADAVKRLEVKQPMKLKQAGVCYFASFYSRLPKEDQKTLDELIERGVSSVIIIRLLAEEGYKTGVERFNDHRHNRCKCENKESK